MNGKVPQKQSQKVVEMFPLQDVKRVGLKSVYRSFPLI